MTRTASSNPNESTGSTKARILGAAEDVFAERGFDGSSTREIAARAQVNISSLHYHWASKETLYLAVFRDVFERIVTHLQTSIAKLVEDHADRAVIVDVVMGELFDFFESQPNITRLLMRRIVDPDVHAAGIEREVLVPAWDVFAAWVGRAGLGFSDRETRLFMLSLLSVLVVYLLDSPVYRSLLGSSVHEPDMRDAVRRHIIELVQLLMARSQPGE